MTLGIHQPKASALLPALLLALLWASIPVCAAPQADSEGIEQALRVPDVLVLDVRTQAELEANGMIEGSVHIPIDELESRLTELPKDRPILVA